MTKELFIQYSKLKIQERAIKRAIDEIASKLKEEMIEAQADKVESEVGTFVLSKRKLWKFSDAVIEMELKADELRKQEMADGTAGFTESSVLIFREKETVG